MTDLQHRLRVVWNTTLSNQAADRITELEAQVYELTQDAERYRWLRKAGTAGYWVAHGSINGGLSRWCGNPLDEAIDAAMTPNGQGQRAAKPSAAPDGSAAPSPSSGD